MPNVMPGLVPGIHDFAQRVRGGDIATRDTRRAVVILILATTAIRLVFGWALGLGVDESYMVATGRSLAFGYFDHPPAAWWMQWAAAHLFGTDAPLAVRLPFILAFALSTWLMYRLGAAVAGPRAGLWAAVLLNLSPVFGVTTGTWVLPDGPLDCALLGAAVCLVHALSSRGRSAWGWWIGAGLCAGLALFSKYSAVLTIGGAFLYLATSRTHRRWLARPEPYVAGLLAVLVFLPVVVWNVAHDWASFAFQGDRATGLRFRPLQPFVVLGGEALYVLPWIWLPMMAVLVRALRQGPAEWRGWLLCCLGAPPIVAFVAIAAWSSQRVMFHWAAPGYLMLFPLLGAAVAERINERWVRQVLIGTAALIIGAVAVISIGIRSGWFHPLIATIARQDPEIEGVDWTSLRTQLAPRGLLAPGTVIGVPNWRDAGKIAYALGPSTTVIVLDPDARQFGFVHPARNFVGRSVLVLPVGPPNAIPRSLSTWFASIEPLAPGSIDAWGQTLEPVSVMLGHGLRVGP